MIRKYNISRIGHQTAGGADTLLRLPKLEMSGGKLFNSDKDRLLILALLLENVGIDAAVRLGPPQSWRKAIAALPNKRHRPTFK